METKITNIFVWINILVEEEKKNEIITQHIKLTH